MKRTILPILLLISLIMPQPFAAAAECAAKSMILYEPRTGTVLEEKYADERLLVASTTKIMTALVVLERCPLQDRVLVTAQQAGVEGSSMYLRAGESYTVEELLYGLLLVSGNDAALALAVHTAGSVGAVAALMNEKCSQLGLENTHFSNPHGLDAETHYSSARDLAILTAAAMENSVFCRIFATKHAAVHGVTLVNHNRLLSELDGCIGGKTGYTKAAGRVLVSCAERDGLRLICVTISDPEDWNDHKSAYEAAFASYRFLQLPAAEWASVPVLSGLAEELRLDCASPGVLLRADAHISVDVALPRFVFAPVSAGDAVGRVTVFSDGERVLSEPLCAANAVALDRAELLTARERFRRGWSRYCRYSRCTVIPMYD